MRMPTCSLSSLSISISKLHLPSFAAANYTTKNMATAAALSVANGACQAYLESKFVRENKEGVAELCRHFYTKRWVSGTGGSVTMNVHDDSIPKSQQLIVMSPSGVQKERMLPEDMYVLSSTGCILSTPSPKPYPHKHPKCIDCAPLFMEAGRYHYLFDAAIRNFQLGLYWSVPSHGPIQRVFAHQRNTNMTANAAVNLKNAAKPSHHCIVLDIEGTTTPISFVTDSLFPYARDNVGKHLYLTYDTEETQDDIKLLRAQVDEDLRKGVADAVPIPTSDAGKDEVIASLVANVEAMINADRKVSALKQLQGHIWRTGFQNDELQGVVFDDVPDALQKWHASGIKVYIYSSGSREAQRLIFGNSNHGDLRKYLCGYFDTAVGNKKETRSYLEISQSLGVDEPSDILFVTDVIQEAVAAKAAGLEVIISVRPGNAPIPENHGFKTVRTLLEI